MTFYKFDFMSRKPDAQFQPQSTYFMPQASAMSSSCATNSFTFSSFTQSLELSIISLVIVLTGLSILSHVALFIIILA